VVKLNVWAENTDVTTLEPYVFLERDGYIAMEAEHYYDKHDVGNFGFKRLENYGRTLSAMKVLPPVHNFIHAEDRPYLEYRFVAQQEGQYIAEFYLAPSNTAYMDRKLYMGIQLNEEEVRIENAVSDHFRSLDCRCDEWVSAVKDNIRIYKSKVLCKKGMNQLRFYAVSPFLVLERIVLYPEASPIMQSYLGPKESYFKIKQ
jgi:hypothetical protein